MLIYDSLQVKFSSDTIDETDTLEETLKPRVDSLGGTLEKIQLSGNHITPCIQVKVCFALLPVQNFVPFWWGLHLFGLSYVADTFFTLKLLDSFL